MPRRIDDGPVLHPSEVEGSSGWYAKGCRCDGCRAANAKLARDRRKRIATGTPGEYDKVPNDEAREVVLRMRRAGMVWDGMAELVGSDRRDLQRILSSPGGVMTRRLSEQVVAAGLALERNPRLVVRQRKLFHQGERVRWMLGCLMARGWGTQWIGEQVGWTQRLSISTFSYDDVNVRTWARVEGVFKAYHMEWGPSRVSAVRAWRRGIFISDCYDWEGDRFDYRPVPGTLHPELVVEACTYQQKWRYRGQEMLATMHRVYGQWEKDSCAAAALRTWQQETGQTVMDDIKTCGTKSHRHGELPEIWRV